MNYSTMNHQERYLLSWGETILCKDPKQLTNDEIGQCIHRITWIRDNIKEYIVPSSSIRDELVTEMLNEMDKKLELKLLKFKELYVVPDDVNIICR